MRSRIKTAAILISHGSKVSGFDAPLKKVREDLKKDSRFQKILLAYLGINPPSISKAIDRCVQDGFGEIYLLPYFVLSGKHVQEHIPDIVNACQKKHRGLAKIKLCPYLGYDKKITEVVRERLKCL